MAGWRNKNATEPSAYQRALGLLVRREHSRKELGRKPSAKGGESEAADLALDATDLATIEAAGVASGARYNERSMATIDR